jgi:hypothetical protein
MVAINSRRVFIDIPRKATCRAQITSEQIAGQGTARTCPAYRNKRDLNDSPPSFAMPSAMRTRRLRAGARWTMPDESVLDFIVNF